jgi:hypothetical protein
MIPGGRKPSLYVVAGNDRMIAPEQEKSMAERIEAKTTVLASSHAAMLSYPREVGLGIQEASAVAAQQAVPV